MKLLGRDKETIQAVSTMSCLWKIIRFSVMAGEKKNKKNMQRCIFKICVPTSGQPVMYAYNRTDFQEKLADQEERGREVIKNYSHRLFWLWGLLQKQSVDWMDNQAANEQKKKKKQK